jgi:hypothetical protein
MQVSVEQLLQIIGEQTVKLWLTEQQVQELRSKLERNDETTVPDDEQRLS